MKKLIPALALLLVSAVMLATSSFAWFSMNTSVTVTGMSVTAKVNDNLQIAPTTTAATAKEDDSAFKYGYVMTHTTALLEPVSSINGVNFFYTSTKNVSADGDAASDTYVAYDPDTPAAMTAFNTNYGSTGAVGYVDYAVQLKADNSSNSPKDVVLSDINLTYAGTAAAQSAFRVAVFVWDMGATGATAASAPTQSKLVSLLKMDGSAYYTDGKAVTSTSALGDIDGAADDAATIGEVAANSTKYFKVVVRLWLEGEDESCTNATFASLTQTWDFDLTFKFDGVATGADEINQEVTASKLNLSTGPSTGSEARVVDGVEYYEISGNSNYYTRAASTAVAYNTIIYNIDSNGVVLDVTNRCTLPAQNP